LVLNPSSLDLQGATSWAWGDLDNDGSVDILVRKNGSTNYHQLVMYRGSDSSEPPYWVESPELLKGIVESRVAEGIVLVDLDGDDKLNLVTQVEIDPSKNKWGFLYWQRDSSGVWMPDSTVFQGIEIPGSYYFINDPSFADVDSDGDLDMILGNDSISRGSPFRFFENVGDASTAVWKEDSTRMALVNQNLFGFNNWSPILMYVNKDSLLDLVIAIEIESIHGFVFYPGINDSTGVRWSAKYESFWEAYEGSIRKLIPFDFNQDGLQELIILEFLGSGRVYKVIGNSAIYTRVGPIRFPRYSSALLFDYNHDNHLDFLATGLVAGWMADEIFSQSYEREIIRGRAFWKSTRWFILPKRFADIPHYKSQIMDFNQNGFPDFVFSGSQPRSNRTDFLAFENSDPDLQGTWVQRDDLIAPFQSERTAKDTVFFDPSFADLNNDGDPDLFVTEMILTGQDSGRARYKFYQNLISPDSIIWKERGDWLTGRGQQTFHQSNFGDLDFDGDEDLIIGTKSGTLIFYENIGNAALPKWQLNTGVFTGIDVGEFATPATGDFDGDGKIDLLVGSHEGDIFFYRNETIVSVENIEEEIPQIFNLLQNYPNPCGFKNLINHLQPPWPESP